MRLTEWQKDILKNDDLDVHELITIRGVGKTTFGLHWVQLGQSNCDTSIVIKRNKKEIDSSNKLLDGYNKSIIFTTADDLMNGVDRGINLTGNVRVFVDEYLGMDINIRKLDDALGTTDYKVLFAGSKESDDDKYKISFSKWYYVGVEQLIRDYDIYENTIKAHLSWRESLPLFTSEVN